MESYVPISLKRKWKECKIHGVRKKEENMKRLKNRIGWLAAGVLATNGCLFCMMFRAPKKCWEQDKYDCAVVCGCQVEEDGTPSDLLRSRVEKAVELWKEKKVRYLIMSGAAVHNAYVEAEAMKQYAMELGVPEDYILEEKQAVSTYHNLMYAAKLMRHCGFRDCVVVTNGWHLRKADHYARRSGVRYVMAAAENPQEQSLRQTICLYIETNLHMYLNMWKGYY